VGEGGKANPARLEDRLAMAMRALVFDVFGTLVDWRSGIADAFRATQVPGEPEEPADAWRARYRHILAEVNNRARPWGNFDELHLVTLQDLLTEQGIDLRWHALACCVSHSAASGSVLQRNTGRPAPYW
jgi:FMN phosphatase YigB (HAD superfamily)